MSLPVAAVGAVVTALLETSVLPEVSIAGIKPDLVLVLAVVIAMAVGFEESIVWALIGGLLLDVLSGRPLGATALGLLLVTGMAALIARFTGTPRALTIGFATFCLAWLFLTLMLVILAATAGTAIARLPVEAFVVLALLDGAVAIVAVVALRALVRRFGSAERVDW